MIKSYRLKIKEPLLDTNKPKIMNFQKRNIHFILGLPHMELLLKRVRQSRKPHKIIDDRVEAHTALAFQVLIVTYVAALVRLEPG